MTLPDAILTALLCVAVSLFATSCAMLGMMQ